MKKLFPLFILMFMFSAFAQNVKYIGDKEKKTAWPVTCEEAEKVKPENRVELTDQQLKEQDYSQSRICTIPKSKPKSMPVVTTSEPDFQPQPKQKSVLYVGDKRTGEPFATNCYEVKQIPSESRIPFYSEVEIKRGGFTISGKCSKPPQPEPPQKPKPKKAAKASNILEVRTYPEFWTDRQITIKGRIELYSLPERDSSGKRIGQAFRILDNSSSIIVLAPESEGTTNLRNAIISNDGDPVEGVFTFIVPKELDASIGATDKTIGKLLTFKLY